MAKKQYVLIKYQGLCGGCLGIQTDDDGDGQLHLSQQLVNPFKYWFERIVVGQDRYYQDVVVYRSCKNPTKYITALGVEGGYKVTGEPFLEDDQPNAFSHWQQFSYSRLTGESMNGLVALYNPSSDRYFVITTIPDGCTPSFNLSRNIEDLKNNRGAFSVETPKNN